MEEGGRPGGSRTEEEIGRMIARLEDWLHDELAEALRTADIVQCEIHCKGSSVKAKVGTVKQSTL